MEFQAGEQTSYADSIATDVVSTLSFPFRTRAGIAQEIQTCAIPPTPTKFPNSVAGIIYSSRSCAGTI